MIHVALDGTFAGFRDAVRPLLAHAVPPERLRFAVEGVDPPFLFPGQPPPTGGTAPSLPRRFFELSRRACAFDAPDRWERVYRVAYRLQHDRSILDDPGDDDVLVCTRRAKHVARDVHKMHAFVRLREVEDERGPYWVAFHRPDHWIVPLAAPHFARRFGDVRFALLTPRGSALHEPGQGLSYGPPAQDPGHGLGEFEALWDTYYANIYNPARTMVDAMLSEMPKKHWATMPETRQIPRLLRERQARFGDDRQAVQLPSDRSLPSLARAVQACRVCPLGDPRLSGVPGEGPPDARIVIVGEQPGDQEDQAGRPFVGPAGEVLEQALGEAGLRREEVYLTNAVKHFSYHRDPTTGRRIHDSPERYVVEVCRTFLFAELDALRPTVTVALGSTAARSVLGKAVPIGPNVGKTFRGRSGTVLVGPHPASLLRRGTDDGSLLRTLVHARDLAG